MWSNNNESMVSLGSRNIYFRLAQIYTKTFYGNSIVCAAFNFPHIVRARSIVRLVWRMDLARLPQCLSNIVLWEKCEAGDAARRLVWRPVYASCVNRWMRRSCNDSMCGMCQEASNRVCAFLVIVYFWLWPFYLVVLLLGGEIQVCIGGGWQKTNDSEHALCLKCFFLSFRRSSWDN